MCAFGFSHIRLRKGKTDIEVIRHAHGLVPASHSAALRMQNALLASVHNAVHLGQVGQVHHMCTACMRVNTPSYQALFIHALS